MERWTRERRRRIKRKETEIADETRRGTKDTKCEKIMVTLTNRWKNIINCTDHGI